MIKSKQFILILAIIFFSIPTSHAQHWQWAYASASVETVSGNGIAVDQEGNSYITGSFSGGTIYEGITCPYSFASYGYLIKYSPSGELIWGREIKGMGFANESNLIDCDKAGNCFVAGIFKGEADFGNNVVLTNNNFYQNFLAKYDADGNIVWAKAIADGVPRFTSINIDKSAEKLLLTGVFSSTVVFGNDTLTGKSTTSYDNSFVARMDTSGNSLWAVPIHSFRSVTSTDIDTDESGNVYVIGSFYDNMTVADTTLTAANGQYDNDIFCTKLNASGVFEWIKQIPGNAEGSIADKAVAVDNEGNCYINGHFSYDLQIDDMVVTWIGGTDVFVAKISGDGETIWAQALGSPNYSGDRAGDIAINGSGNIFVIGDYYADSHQSLYIGDTIIPDIQYASFVAQFNPAGDLVWAKRGGKSVAQEIGSHIDVDETGNCYITGNVHGPISFEDGFEFPDLDDSHVFVAKLKDVEAVDPDNEDPGSGDPDVILNNNAEVGDMIKVYPNPGTSYLVLEWGAMHNGMVSIEIFNSLGQTVYHEAVNVTSEMGFDKKILINQLRKGIYYLKTSTSRGISTKKIRIE